MNIIDISWPITTQSTTYKNENEISIKATKLFEKDQVRKHQLTMSTHTGTHIDAPAHFLKEGVTIEQLDLSRLIGPCRVLDCSMIEEKIRQEDLEPHNITKGERILFKTKNSNLPDDEPFTTDFIYLDATAAEYLVSLEVICVGVDYLSIERGQKDHPAHHSLLTKKIPIIEGLRLKNVAPGSYQLICLPLHLPGLEAAPARAVLATS